MTKSERMSLEDAPLAFWVAQSKITNASSEADYEESLKTHVNNLKIRRGNGSVYVLRPEYEHLCNYFREESKKADIYGIGFVSRALLIYKLEELGNPRVRHKNIGSQRMSLEDAPVSFDYTQRHILSEGNEDYERYVFDNFGDNNFVAKNLTSENLVGKLMYEEFIKDYYDLIKKLEQDAGKGDIYGIGFVSRILINQGLEAIRIKKGIERRYKSCK